MRQALRLLTLAAATIWLATPTLAAPLGDLRWKNRVVVLFGSGAESTRQREWLLERSADLVDRKILILQVDRDVRIVFGKNDTALPGAAALRADLGVGGLDRDETVLIGLDGGVKWRSPTAVRPDALFAVIDAMPMRRAGR